MPRQTDSKKRARPKRSKGTHPGLQRASRGAVSQSRTSSRNNKNEPAPERPGGAPRTPEAETRLAKLRERWRAEKVHGQATVAEVVEAQAVVEVTENGKEVTTSEAKDREALDRLLEAAGFGMVDQLDADDYAMMREAKLEALAQLCEELKVNRGQWRLHPEVLARIARQMGQAEKAKLEVIELKVGKPGDRPKRGVTFKAKIGVQSATDVKAAGAALEVTVEDK